VLFLFVSHIVIKFGIIEAMRTILNLFKTGVLFAFLTALLLAIGYYFGGTQALLPFFIISLVMNFMGYWFSASIALKMARARPLDSNEEREIHEDVRELSARMDIPMPSLYISEEAQPNAFATGRNPKHAAVCVTRGLVKLLDRSEIRGVLAHELAHVKNRDILTGTIAAVMAGSISSLAQLGFFFGGHDEEGRGGGNILMIILAPIAAMLIQLAISRSREYAADESAAFATKEPMGLASALQKIESYARQLPAPAVNPAIASLYISNPFKGRGIVELFSTHPATEKRVERLKSLQI